MGCVWIGTCMNLHMHVHKCVAYLCVHAYSGVFDTIRSRLDYFRSHGHTDMSIGNGTHPRVRTHIINHEHNYAFVRECHEGVSRAKAIRPHRARGGPTRHRSRTANPRTHTLGQTRRDLVFRRVCPNRTLFYAGLKSCRQPQQKGPGRTDPETEDKNCKPKKNSKLLGRKLLT